jgi:hypothetical protein
VSVTSINIAGNMFIPSCDLGRDDRAPDLAEPLALLAALGWTQALFRIREAQRILATSRAGIYRDLAAGRLEAVKIGAATRITAQSLARRLAGLPTHRNINEASAGTSIRRAGDVCQERHPVAAPEPKTPTQPKKISPKATSELFAGG